jgi:GTP diphosphokinase / guanosine-3',5'-bis(diphosphate) 3'-diphosphatase
MLDSSELKPEHQVLQQLLQVLEDQGRPQPDLDEIRKAYAYAEQMHEGQRRKNDENYIVHPVSVALILARITVDTPTLVSALLHDVLEDTDATPEEIKSQFGLDVLKIVEGVTKLGKFEFSSKEDRQAENFRKMFLAMADDVRVIMLKLADRLHNMRTLCFMKPEKQLKISAETLEIFAPLANRMGMGKIRAELEDLSLKYLNPEKHEEIESEIADSQSERETTIQLVIEKIQSQLSHMPVKAKIYGRVKNYYSIYKKMLIQQKKVHDISDISAVRIIVSSETECYEVLGVIHNAFTPIPGRFKDYIAMPKSNLYQSLHTTVIGPYGRPLEVQIRTHDMHRIAEYGIAAHWKYKESGGSVSAASDDEKKLSWLKQMVEFKDNADDAQEYVDSVKLDLFRDEVFVFTPKGKVVDLPKGSTPVDFAYRIHTEVGNTCTGSMVNGKIVQLNHVLRNGDIVEIITTKKSTPRLDWIKFVQTQQAKGRIRQWYKRNFREEHEQQGKQLLEAELTRAIVEEITRSGKLLEISKELNYTNLEDLYLALGYGELNLTRVVNRIKREEPSEWMLPSFKPRAVIRKESGKGEIDGLKGMLYHLAKCCMPVPGEPIVGVVTRSRGVMIHREGCINLNHVNPDRQMFIGWEGEAEKVATHSVKLEINVIDRLGVFKDILIRISDTNTNLADAKVKALADNTAIIEVTVDIHNLDHLDRLKTEIQKVSDVLSVRRFQTRLNKPG